MVSSGRVGSNRLLPVLGLGFGVILGVLTLILFIVLGGIGSPSSSPSSLMRLVKCPNSLDKGLMLALMIEGGYPEANHKFFSAANLAALVSCELSVISSHYDSISSSHTLAGTL